MRSIAVIVDRVADNDVTVLIRGESGVGKELVARAIHDRSVRRSRPFVKVNCAALPDDLLESELFGHEKGAFTGAAALRDRQVRARRRRHADARRDRRDEGGAAGQAAARAAGRRIQPAGQQQAGDAPTCGSSRRPTAISKAMLTRAEFREDLYYRLKVIEIVVPPLRERQDEIAAAHRVLRREVREALQPAASRRCRRRCATALQRLHVAGQHSRARERDEAVRHSAGRNAGAAGLAGRATGGRRRCRRGTSAGREPEPADGPRAGRQGTAPAAALPVAAASGNGAGAAERFAAAVARRGRAPGDARRRNAI